MSGMTGGEDFELEIEIEAELSMAESSHAEEVAERPPSEWLFDPVDVEREEIELRGLLDAVRTVEDLRSGRPDAGEGT